MGSQCTTYLNSELFYEHCERAVIALQRNHHVSVGLGPSHEEAASHDSQHG